MKEKILSMISVILIISLAIPSLYLTSNANIVQENQKISNALNVYGTYKLKISRMDSGTNPIKYAVVWC